MFIITYKDRKRSKKIESINCFLLPYFDNQIIESDNKTRLTQHNNAIKQKREEIHNDRLRLGTIQYNQYKLEPTSCNQRCWRININQNSVPKSKCYCLKLNQQKPTQIKYSTNFSATGSGTRTSPRFFKNSACSAVLSLIAISALNKVEVVNRQVDRICHYLI